MIIKPIAPWWILVTISIVLIAFALWQFWITRRHTRQWRWIRRAGIVALLLLIALRPSVPGGTAPQGMSNIDVLFVVDTTSSIAAEDYNGSQPRLNGVIQDIKDISTELAGAKFSLITFASGAYVDLPFTTDTTALHSLAATLTQEITLYSDGSSIDRPLTLLTEQLERKRESQPNRSTIVYFMSDGEQTDGSTPKSFAPIASYIDSAFVLGYGTSSGGKMREYTGYESTYDPGYIKDRSTSTYPIPDAIAKIDEDNLTKIADDLNGTYVHRTAPGNIDTLVKPTELTEIVKNKRDVATYQDVYWVAAILLAVLMGVELWSVRRTVHDAITLRRVRS